MKLSATFNSDSTVRVYQTFIVDEDEVAQNAGTIAVALDTDPSTQRHPQRRSP